MIDIFTGFPAGLSVGIYCIGLCLPIILPVLLGQKRNLKKGFWIILEFSLGRLLGYLLFGFLIGYLGQKIQNQLLHTLVALINLWTGIGLIIYSLGLIDRKLCSLIPMKKIRWPVLIGFLTGVNVCPPMVASLSYVFGFKDAVKSLAYFFFFFLGTSSYIIPCALFSVFTQSKLVQKIAQLSGIVVGAYFVSKHLYLIF